MAKGKVLKTVIDIAGEISPTLGKSLGVVAGKLEGINLKAIAAGAAVGAIAYKTGKSVVKATKYLATLGDEYNSAVNNIAAGTGLVGEELEGMSDVLKDVYGSNFGESMEDAAAGITAVYRATGLTEDALADATKAAYALSDTFGYDISESARAAKAMMTNFGISGDEAMGLIAAGAQNGLDYSGELIDSINEYSVQFSKLGFTADDMFNIFQQGADSGAWNLDKVGDAVKEFSIRSIDGSKTTTEAFQALGLDADKMMATFASGGDDAALAFQGVLTALMDMDDQVQRDALGVSLFGTQWEDLGTEAMVALADINTEAYNTEDALGKINEVKYDNLTDAFDSIKRQAEVSLLPLASTIAEAFTEMAPIIGELFEELGPIIEQTTKDMMPFVNDFLKGATDLLKKLMPYVQKLADALLPILSDLVSELLPPILDMVDALLPPLMDIVTAILPPIMDILTTILPILTEIASAILPVLVAIIEALLPALEPVLDVLVLLLNDVILPLLDPLLSLVEELLPAIAPIIDVLTACLKPFVAVLEVVGDVLEFIVGLISTIVGWIADGFGWVANFFTGGATSAEFSEQAAKAAENQLLAMQTAKAVTDALSAQAPGYATGGITNGVSIAGEDPRYPHEYIISLNPAYRQQNLSYWAQAGRMLGADASDFHLGGSTGGSSVSLGGITFAPNITITGRADKGTIMEAIEEEYPEFIDMLDEYLMSRGVTVYA